ncbi:hypothetical protein DERP_011799 [Dermatophagoides pteronyssinus]|uniref:Uncharacterized protein LOC113790198 n=2 Tax=Dermatophagoides pteronyssinus TaxID=6956 RepID=A0A6P6XQB7_DERPT|nr:uncharacterized protein LOC113790198 [Dermatophagoides pteronyssinus]KAH9425071.1 hypothetical protein DERP_011799 [Dermatophagoides pteronyssinus]
MFNVVQRLYLFLLFILLSITINYCQNRIKRFAYNGNDPLEYIHPYICAFIHKQKMLANCMGVLIGKDGEILVTANCINIIAKNKSNYFVYVGHTRWGNNYRSIDDKFVYDIHKIIPHLYDETGIHDPFHDLAIVKIRSKDNLMPTSRALLLFSNIMDVKFLKNCQFIGWWENNRIISKIETSLKDNYDICLKSFKGFEEKNIYCLDVFIDCQQFYGDFYGSLFCVLNVDSSEMNFLLSMAKFVIEKCEKPSESVNNVYVAVRLSVFKEWIEQRIEILDFNLPPMVSTFPTEKTTTSKNQRNKSVIDFGFWDFRISIDFSLDNLNILPCSIFFLLMFIALLFFSFIECAYL